MKKITEEESPYHHLEKMSFKKLITAINQEDMKVAYCVQKQLPQIEKLIRAAFRKMKQGGRLFYIGAGTSGRLGILDASECPPTYGVEYDRVIGLIAGGDKAIRRAVEHAEDDEQQGWKDLKKHKISEKDFVVGLSASGTTPYVVGAIKACREHHIATGCITCNPGTPLATLAQYPVEIIVGPEFVTGSTRMKAGTAQKMALNMISSTLMIKLGHVHDNKMIDMRLSNNKLKKRGATIVSETLSISLQEAHQLLRRYGSVRKALSMKKSKNF